MLLTSLNVMALPIAMALHRPKAGRLRQRHAPGGGAGGVPIGGLVGMLPHQLTMPGKLGWKQLTGDVETGKLFSLKKSRI